MELEWKWNRPSTKTKVHEKKKGNGIEMERQWDGIKMVTPVEVKFVGLEWKRKGIGIERLGKTIILSNRFGSGMEWKWKGMESSI